MPGRLVGKTAFITGSSSGLGRAIALRFAAEGANICCADLTPHVPTNAEESHTHDAITAAHGSGRSIFVKADVTSGSDLEAAVKECVKAFGRLDIVVPSAGIAREASQSGLVKCHEVSDDFFDLVIAINLKGVFLTCKYAIAQMLKQEPLPGADRGWVINIASIAGLIAFEGAFSYCTSKGGVVQMTKQMAIDYAKDRIHVNCLCPGFVKTPMTQHLQDNAAINAHLGAMHPWAGGGLGEPDAIAKAALFLASDEAQWVTGVALPVDGGYVVQ